MCIIIIWLSVVECYQPTPRSEYNLYFPAFPRSPASSHFLFIPEITRRVAFCYRDPSFGSGSTKLWEQGGEMRRALVTWLCLLGRSTLIVIPLSEDGLSFFFLFIMQHLLFPHIYSRFSGAVYLCSTAAIITCFYVKRSCCFVQISIKRFAFLYKVKLFLSKLFIVRET